jgi:hypothetical protein
VADIEPAAELPLFGGQSASDYSVRIYHAPPPDEQARFQARVAVPQGRQPDGWAVLREAINQASPPSAESR